MGRVGLFSSVGIVGIFPETAYFIFFKGKNPNIIQLFRGKVNKTFQYNIVFPERKHFDLFKRIFPEIF